MHVYLTPVCFALRLFLWTQSVRHKVMGVAKGEEQEQICQCTRMKVEIPVWHQSTCQLELFTMLQMFLLDLFSLWLLFRLFRGPYGMKISLA